MADVALFEFDDDRTAIIEPGQVRRRHDRDIPSRAVLCFYSEILDALPDEAEQIGTLRTAASRL